MPDFVDKNVPGEQKGQRSQALARLAARQDRVVTLTQLLTLGFTYGEVRERIKIAHLHRLFPGVFSVGTRKLTQRGTLRAALLSAGDGAWLSGRTAAAMLGLRPINLRAIEVTVCGGGRRRRSGFVLHRSTAAPHPDDIRVRDGLRYSSLPRMLIEVASRETPQELDRLITQAARKNLLDVEQIEAALARHPRRPGIGKLGRALRDYRPRAEEKSTLERDFAAYLERHPEIPPPQRNVTIDVWEIDCYWPEQKVAVELDGRSFHVARRDTEKDRYKDAKLMVRGVLPLRITDRRFARDAAGAIEDRLKLLQLR